MEFIVTISKSFKGELLKKLKVWNNRFPGYLIRFFRSDNASEMPTSEELAVLGIENEPIVSYSPEQNGFAEAMNKILIRNVKISVSVFEN